MFVEKKKDYQPWIFDGAMVLVVFQHYNNWRAAVDFVKSKHQHLAERSWLAKWTVKLKREIKKDKFDGLIKKHDIEQTCCWPKLTCCENHEEIRTFFTWNVECETQTFTTLLPIKHRVWKTCAAKSFLGALETVTVLPEKKGK